MEPCLIISNLNDFIFCPRSIYFHNLFGNKSTELFHREYQKNGHAAHETIDNKNYSTRKETLMALPVFSEKYNLCGKIDIYHGKEKLLVERKKKITEIYDGYRYQLYAQYYCMLEMGYEVESLAFHSLSDNNRIPVELPDDNKRMEFESVIDKIQRYDLETEFTANQNKCEKCVYSSLCDYSKAVANA